MPRIPCYSKIGVEGPMVFDGAMVTCYSRFRFQSGLWFAGFRTERLPSPPNGPLIYPKYLLLRAMRAPLKGHWGVLVNGQA